MEDGTPTSPPTSQPTSPPTPVPVEEEEITPSIELAAESRPRRYSRRPRSGKYYCKRFLQFLFSHVGLCTLVVAYSIMGGFMFEHLEMINEKDECVRAWRKYAPLENATVFEISTAIRNESGADNLTLAHVEKLLKIFRHEVLELGYDGEDCARMGTKGGPTYRWSFPGALLFSVTVITTIGYGHVAPRTFRGRVGCILYASLGVPLMLLWLAKLGDALADIFRFVYMQACRPGACRHKKRSVQVRDEETRKAKEETASLRATTPEPEVAAVAVPVEDDDGNRSNNDDKEEEEEEEEETVTVPLWMAIVIIGGYIVLGSVLFGIWEGWPPFDAAYFCFVTISTIGFGDMVPGASADFNNTEDQWKLIGAAVYILFGMATLSMCFSLMQEEIVTKVRWVGLKLGIVEDDDEDDEAVQRDAVEHRS